MTATQMPEHRGVNSKIKFVVGGLLIAAAIVYLITTSIQENTQYYLTVEETLEKYAKGELEDRNLRVSGAVIGESINYDVDELRLEFTVVHIPGSRAAVEEEGGLAEALHLAVNDPSRKTLDVVYEGPKPDLLQDEAQAIMTGQIGKDGVLYADELLLKCPTKYEEAIPEQAG